MNSKTDLKVVLVVIVSLYLQCVTTLDLKLTVEESLPLGVECTNIDSTLAFEHGKEVLCVNESHFANRRTNELKDLLTSDLVIDLKRASEVDRNFEVTRERAEKHVLDLVIGTAKYDLIEDAELLEGGHANFL